MRLKGGGSGKKFGEITLWVLEACNPLKSHKTAKALFGKAWSKTRQIWKSLEKCKVARHYFAISAASPANAVIVVAKASTVYLVGSWIASAPRKRNKLLSR
jgi:hypothetical protein